MKTILKANPNNPRKISPEVLEALKKSLKTFGDLGGIVFNRKTGNLVGGHQRLEVFRAGGAMPVPIVERQQKRDTQGTVAVGYVTFEGSQYRYREVEWDKQTETAAMLAANKFSGEWEWEGVSKLLQELKNGGFEEMSLTGFEQHELDTLLNAEWNPPVISPAPPSEGGTKSDQVHLTQAAREVLDACKKMINEGDDAACVERVCKFFIKENR
jgi:hypothetical protein